MKDIGIGIIGLGMGSAVLAVNQIPDSRLVVRGICDINPQARALCQQQYEFAVATEDYRELLRREDIQIIGVYSPDHLHAEHALAALEAGKHVICTKPMCVSIAEAESLVAAVDGTGLKFLVGQTCRFVLHYMAAHDLLVQGRLGEVVYVEAHYVHDMRPYRGTWRYQAPQDFNYGGVCHPIDLVRWFAGDIDEVHAYGAKAGISGHPMVGNFVYNLRFKSGAIGRVLGLFDITHPPMGMLGLSVMGTRAAVVEGSVLFDGDEEARNLYQPEPLEGHSGEVIRYVLHLEQCILQNKDPSPGVREGARCIAACQAGWQSVHTGQPVKVRNEF